MLHVSKADVLLMTFIKQFDVFRLARKKCSTHCHVKFGAISTQTLDTELEALVVGDKELSSWSGKGAMCLVGPAGVALPC